MKKKQEKQSDMARKQWIRFDWALKKLLRNKANFGILEGLLSELFLFDVKIKTILESEGNQSYELDKYNRVDILVESETKELILVEFQNNSERDFFHRMLYGSSKLITEYIQEGEKYGSIKKIFSVNILYFDLGYGDDYVYDYDGNFIGRHTHSILEPTSSQKKAFQIEEVKDIFPKYYLLKINNFNNIAKDSLDEWVYFLKNSELYKEPTAKGLKEAEDKLRYERLSQEEKKSYDRFLENQRIALSEIDTAQAEVREEMEILLREERKQKEDAEKRAILLILKLYESGLSVSEIAQIALLEEVEVYRIIANK